LSGTPDGTGVGDVDFEDPSSPQAVATATNMAAPRAADHRCDIANLSRARTGADLLPRDGAGDLGH